jgi:glycerol-3-phosphate O-acyltransferase
MTNPVALPFWLVVLLVLFAIIGLFDRIFRPSVRWFVRRRLNLAIDEPTSGSIPASSLFA